MIIEGKAAVVTGASRGVGRETAIGLAKRGCAVLVNYSRNQEGAEETVAIAQDAGVKALCFKADVSDDAACREMMAMAERELGRLDILVNNAGTTRFTPHSDLEAVTMEDWQRILGVNVVGPFQCIRAARPFMEHTDEGEIVNVASIAGYAAAGSSVPYCASKAAVISMTTQLARALGPVIRMNAIAPGFIAGEWTQAGFGDAYEAKKAALEAQTALGRVCEPKDVADAIISIIAGSDLITGQTIVVDGGQTIGAKVT